MFDRRRIVQRVKEQFELDWYGVHGLHHFNRVKKNGLILAAKNGADVEIVELFSLLHDACRIYEVGDPYHGEYSAEFATQLWRERLFFLPPAKLDALMFAIEHHSDKIGSSDITICTCWDADRLDLARVGKLPDPDRLYTQEAKELNVIKRAVVRSVLWLTERSISARVCLDEKPVDSQ